MKPDAPKKRAWPIWATGPLGNRARFDCLAEVPPKWRVEGAASEPSPVEDAPEPPKNKGGRPKKVAP